MAAKDDQISGSFTFYAALHARQRPDDTAFTYVNYSDDRLGVATSLSWAELHGRARNLARLLVRKGFRPGARAAILAPQGLDYVVAFLGSLYAGVIAVPLFAPGLLGNAARLTGALSDCRPEVWLTTTAALEDVLRIEGVPAPAEVVAVDAIRPVQNTPLPIATPGDLAYLQYTSGSTRSPAGAVITHGNVVANAGQALAALNAGPGHTAVSWLPLFHDMGLVLSIAAPIVGGLPSVFIDPFAFVQRPLRWLRLLAAHPRALSAAPNFAFDLTAERVSAEDRRSLDLGGVEAVLNGSEPIRAATLTRFIETFAESGLRPEAVRPSYGLAEATVFVTTSPAGQAPRVTAFDRDALAAGHAVLVAPDAATAASHVGCGRPIGQRIIIVDAKTQVVRAEGEVGEIWVQGPNVAEGYWGAPERSAEVFGGAWLRTGDLGLIHDAHLYITGRAKDLIIVDGRNHYPQDIEVTVQDAHAAIRRDRVAAFGAVAGDHEGVVVVAEHSRHTAEEDLDPAAVARAVRGAVAAAHDVPLHDFVLVRPGTVPRTSSGKIARAAARSRYLEGGFATAEGAS